jgi:glycosyltransferase involved in cell wall biosynthesis
VVTVSRATRDTLFEYFPNVSEERVVAAPLGLDPVFFEDPGSEALELAARRVGPGPFVLNVGNESPHKNHRRAILAFLEAFKERPEMRFVIVRRLVRHDPDLVALLEKSDVKRRIVLLEYAELPILRALYRLAHLFFFPSWVEGFGLPILEAMASGTPVVTSDRGALLEVAGDAASTVSPYSVSAMANALLELSEDEKRRASLKERGLARASEFSWERCARTTLSVYEQALRASSS